jgi:exonuclease SbcD
MLMMHTSDWHAGRTLYNQPRAGDLDDALTEIVGIAASTRPDVIINSGDVIDHARVAHADVERVVDALVELAAIAPTVVVAGNHDSFSLLRSFHQLSRRSQLHFVSAPLGRDGDYLVLPGRDGTTTRLGALPFVHAQRGIDVFDDPRRWAGDYRGRVADIQAAIVSNLTTNPSSNAELTVFAAHLHVTNAKLSKSERARHVTDDYATTTEAMRGVDYAAFGHIHEAQELPGPVTGGYAGSPIPLDFGEKDQTKSVTLVNLEPGRPAKTERIELRGGRQLVTFSGTLEELKRRAGGIGDALCLVTVETATHDPALTQRVHDLLERATVLDVVQHARDTKLSDMVVEPGSASAQRPLMEAFNSYLADRGTRKAPAKAVSAIMAEFLAADDEDRHPCFPVEDLLASSIHEGEKA